MNINNTLRTKCKTPAELATYLTNGKWKLTEHLEVLNRQVYTAAHLGNEKLIVNMPPRHGKSELISKWLPLWYLANYPKNRIMLATYNQRFASTWGRKVKDLVKFHGKELGIELRKDAASTDDFLLTEGGGMTAIGADGTLTGRGANLLIIDDPIKNDTEANSQTTRDALWEWFNSTAYTRLEPNGSIILTMTRWHEDDICGRLLTPNNDKLKWRTAIMPAIAEENDICGRKTGQPLWPERYDNEKLNEIKTQIGYHWFQAMYQQNPAPTGGNLFKKQHFRYFSMNNHNGLCSIDCRHSGPDKTPQPTLLPMADISVYAVVDLAATTSETADYTVLLVFGVTPQKQILILDVHRVKFEACDHLELLQELNQLWKPKIIGIEAVQYQIALVQMARRQNLPVKELRPDKDKVSRALLIATMIENGNVLFKQDASWLQNFESELLAFPKGRHDDQVDALAYIATLIQPMLEPQQNQYRLLVGKTKQPTSYM